MPFGGPPNLKDDVAAIAALAARHCRLPHPDVVARCGAAIFPTIRDQQRRGTLDTERRLLLDDNVTPRWALFWAHGMPHTHHPRGWTIAHAWSVYGWRPQHADTPVEPAGYDRIEWAYFDPYPDPQGFIRDRMMALNNQRVVALRQLMELADG